MTWVVVPAAGRGLRFGADVPKQYLEIDGEFARGLPRARLQVLTAIQEFFVVNIYDFGVKIGPLKVQK